MAIKTHPCIYFFFSALEYTLLRWLTAIGMTSSSPTLHHSESVPHLPYWPCRNRWSLSVCSICTSGIGVRTSSVLSRGTWILAAMTVSAVPSSSMFVFMTKTGWMLWIRHHPLTQWFPLTCSWFPASLSSYAHVKVTDFLGTPYQSKFMSLYLTSRALLLSFMHTLKCTLSIGSLWRQFEWLLLGLYYVVALSWARISRHKLLLFYLFRRLFNVTLSPPSTLLQGLVDCSELKWCRPSALINGQWV